mmetsp:Transcript_15612/g.26090  ORF Transcript_15612/g.26090 Transcript_15612/m.26090 type:complete len:372 (-) Transcript_15612:2370-3485(-)
MTNETAASVAAAAAASTTTDAANSTRIAAPNDEISMLDEEWQDVEHASVSNKEPGSLLGSRLAQLAVGTMARHGTTVQTPLAAISLALHAALCSTDVLGFVCTGIPETETTTTSGFAPPIRELPKTQFVPLKWEQQDNTTENTNEIRLRYRKAAVGSVALLVCVTADDQQVVQVSLTPTKTNEPPSELLTFRMEDHVNLASFEKAATTTTPGGSVTTAAVLPALHYKALATLLTNFVNTFDLGSIREEDESTSTTVPEVTMLPYTTVVPLHAPSSMPSSDPLRIPSRRQIPPVGYDNPMGVYNPHENPTIQVFQQQQQQQQQIRTALSLEHKVVLFINGPCHHNLSIPFPINTIMVSRPFLPPRHPILIFT